jgi:lipid-binding SYLF domain-containing protein
MILFNKRKAEKRICQMSRLNKKFLKKGVNMKTKRCICITSTVMLIAVMVFLAPKMSGFTPAPAFADDALDARHLVDKARQTLEVFAVAREMEGFRQLVKDARGVFIAPQILKGAFIIGASGGSGVLLVRDKKTGEWTGPAFYTIGEASFGLQIGGEASEVILLIMTERGVTALLSSSVKLGADIGVAVGPVGVGVDVSTANLSADIISFARSKGLYGGISVEGAVVKVREGLNKSYYGKKVTPTDILIRKAVKNSHSAPLIETVSKGVQVK